MSIKTQLEPYCEKCEKFEPVKDTMHSDDGPELTTITCKHAKECKKMCEYLKSSVSEKCEKEHVTPNMHMQLLDYRSLRDSVSFLVRDIVPSASGCGDVWGINRVREKFKEQQTRITKLKIAVGGSLGLIVGNILAMIIF
jgi:hypothetical protein